MNNNGIKPSMNTRRLSQDNGTKPSVEFANDTKLHSAEGFNSNKQKNPDMEALTRKIKKHNTQLDEFVTKYIEEMGRKPDADEIRENLTDSTDPDILASFLKDYN